MNGQMALLAAWGLMLSSTLHAQTVSLVPFDTDVLGLTATSSVVTKTFQVDSSATEVTFDLVSPSPHLSIQITTPAGVSINPETVGTVGGTFATTTIDQPPAGGIPSPFTLIGTHYTFTFPNPPPGNYLLRIDGTATGQENTIVFVSMISDSAIAVAITTAQPDYQLKDHIGLTAFVFNGDFPLAAEVKALIFREHLTAEVPVMLTLKDDGELFDPIAGDGLYTGVVPAADLGLGKFLVSVIAVSDPPGLFRRTAGTSFTITDNLAEFTGNFSDQGIDDDGDNLLDRVQISMGANVFKPGQYDFIVSLTASNNVSISGHTIQTLPIGAGQLSVDFLTKDLKAMGAPGPYVVDLLLEYLDLPRAALADEIKNAGQTQLFNLDALPPVPIAFTGFHEDMGVDTNGNGKFEKLQVNIEVNLQTEGTYQWSGRLLNSFGRDIDFATQMATLPSGQQKIALLFDGQKIGGGGIDGPYLLKDFTISGAGNTLTIPEQINTAAYRFTDFEGLVTTIQLSPAPNQAGWNRTDVTATLTAVDPSGGSGIQSIHSRVNFQDEVVTSGNQATVTLSQEGASTLSYFAVDNAGVREPMKSFRIGIDKSPPAIIPEIPFPVLIGTHLPSFFRATDLLSGVKMAEGAFNGVPIDQGAPVTLTQLGVNTRSMTATDFADNTVTINQVLMVCDADGFINTDGDALVNCVDPDDDNDGVLDVDDECPFLSTLNVIVGTSGRDKLFGTSGNDLIRGAGRG